VVKGHPDYYQDVAQRLAEEIPGAWWANQFANPANPRAHETTTGPEIWEQMNQDLDAVICGVGSGGTITGLSRFFAEADPSVEMILADPEGSVLADYVETGTLGTEVGSWLVEGIGEDFLPPNCDLSRTRRAYVIPDGESFETARTLMREEGLVGGSSSGTLVAAALRYCRAQNEARRVVTFVCDGGAKYLSKMYNDYWMEDQGFLERPPKGDLSDLIARRHEDHATVTVSPDESLSNAYNRMRLYDISQLPVIDDAGTIVGIIDESDILAAVLENRDRFQDPVTEAMNNKLETVPVSSPLKDLMPVFNKDYVAIVMDGKKFLGLITQIDLINYLRRRLA
jgi:cystathionine beta-synthase